MCSAKQRHRGVQGCMDLLGDRNLLSWQQRVAPTLQVGCAIDAVYWWAMEVWTSRESGTGLLSYPEPGLS